MKTLDEVIKAYEICIGYYCTNTEHDVCPYLGMSDMGCMKEPEKDALYYLKEYREKHDEILKMEEALGYCEMADNRPLTWSELKQMEGKPVWVEEPSFFGKRWVLISGLNSEAVFGTSIGSMVFYTKDEQGMTWQAYRKERE